MERKTGKMKDKMKKIHGMTEGGVFQTLRDTLKPMKWPKNPQDKVGGRLTEVLRCTEKQSGSIEAKTALPHFYSRTSPNMYFSAPPVGSH